MIDQRLKQLAEQVEAREISRREFVRRSAVITGGTAAGLHVLNSMATAQAQPKLRIWLFKSFVTAGNDVLAKQIETVHELTVGSDDWPLRYRDQNSSRHRAGTRPTRG